MNVWIITSEYNDYDQHGSYFEEVYKDKPTPEQLKDFLLSRGEIHVRNVSDYIEKRVNHLLNGGGRLDSEHVWYTLQEVKAL